MSIEQVVTVSLPASSAAWDVLSAIGRDLTGATRVVVLRAESTDFLDDVQAQGSDDEQPTAAIAWLGRPDVITIAAIGGRVAGAGLDVAVACDLRIVADDAQLAASRSIGTIGRLGELMGPARALAFLLTGGSISGRQAAASGLANLSVPPGKLDAAVAELVATLLSTSREVATVAKAVLVESVADRRRVADELIIGLRLAATES